MSNIQTSDSEFISIKLRVIINSIDNRVNINGFTGILSTILPLNGASITPGIRCIAVTVAIKNGLAPKFTSIEKIATLENHAPK